MNCGSALLRTAKPFSERKLRWAEVNPATTCGLETWFRSTGSGMISAGAALVSQSMAVLVEKSPEVISASGASSPGELNCSRVGWAVGLEAGLVGAAATGAEVGVLRNSWVARGVGRTGVGGMITRQAVRNMATSSRKEVSLDDFNRIFLTIVKYANQD